jgi:hypothetical protein
MRLNNIAMMSKCTLMLEKHTSYPYCTAFSLKLQQSFLEIMGVSRFFWCNAPDPLTTIMATSQLSGALYLTKLGSL